MEREKPVEMSTERKGEDGDTVEIRAEGRGGVVAVGRWEDDRFTFFEFDGPMGHNFSLCEMKPIEVTFEELMDRARGEFFSSLNFEKSLSTLKKSISLPNLSRPSISRGKNLYSEFLILMGKGGAALEFLKCFRDDGVGQRLRDQTQFLVWRGQLESQTLNPAHIDEWIQKRNPSAQEPEILELKGILALQRNEIGESESFLRKAKDLFESSNNQEKAVRMDMWLAKALSIRERYDDALEKHLGCRRSLEKRPNNYWRLFYDLEIGHTHLLMGNTAVAASILNQLWAETHKMDFPAIKSRINLYLAIAHSDDGKFAMAMRELRLAASVPCSPIQASDVFLWMGTVAGKLGKLEKAKEHFKRSKEERAKVGLFAGRHSAIWGNHLGGALEEKEPEAARNVFIQLLAELCLGEKMHLLLDYLKTTDTEQALLYYLNNFEGGGNPAITETTNMEKEKALLLKWMEKIDVGAGERFFQECLEISGQKGNGNQSFENFLEQTQPSNVRLIFLKWLRSTPDDLGITINALGSLGVIYQKRAEKMGKHKKYLELSQQYFEGVVNFLFILLRKFKKIGSRERYRERYKKFFDFYIFSCINTKSYNKIIRVVDIWKSICEFFYWEEWHKTYGKILREEDGEFDWSPRKVYEKNPVDKVVVIFYLYGDSKLIRVVLEKQEWVFSGWIQFSFERFSKNLRGFSRKLDVSFDINENDEIEWNNPVDSGWEKLLQKSRGASVELYNAFIKGIEPHLPRDPKEHVVFVPHGIFSCLPIYAMKNEATGKYLVETNTISVISSLFAYEMGRRMRIVGERMANPSRKERVGALLLADADSVDSRGRRLSNRGEVETIQRYFNQRKEKVRALTKEHLIKSNIREKLSKSIPFLIHFGTHFSHTSRSESVETDFPLRDMFGERKATESLCDPTGSFGLSNGESLTCADIGEMPLLGTALAVLNGCNTLRGKRTLEGDVQGARLQFFFGGVPFVVGAMTPVLNDFGLLFAKKFYEYLDPGKCPITQTLRKALLSLIKMKTCYELGFRDCCLLWGGYQGFGYEGSPFCGICGKLTHVDDFFIPRCGHGFCKDCYASYCKEKIGKGEVILSNSRCATIVCPMKDCSEHPQSYHYFSFLGSPHYEKLKERGAKLRTEMVGSGNLQYSLLSK